MAYSTKKTSFNKLLLIVFGIAFGVVGLALAYQAAQTTSDLRSRAAQTNQIYKQWEFNGDTTEGWSAVAPYTATVDSGQLIIASKTGNALPVFRNTKVATAIPAGLKSISMSMAVGSYKLARVTPSTCPLPPVCEGWQTLSVTSKGNSSQCPKYTCIQMPDDVRLQQTVVSDQADDAAFQKSVSDNQVCPMDFRRCSDGTYVGRTGNGCAIESCPGPKTRTFIAQVYYKRLYKDDFEKPLTIRGTADGIMHTYTVNLPDAGAINLERIRVVFSSGVRPVDNIAVDWVRVLGPVSRPTAKPCTPRPACLDANPACALDLAPGTVLCPPSPKPTCVPLPTCAPGAKCIRPMYYPQGGWCTDNSVPPSGGSSGQRLPGRAY